MRLYILIICLVGGIVFSAKAQKPDTVAHKNTTDDKYRKLDSASSKPFVPKYSKKVKVYHPDTLHSPHKAVIRSLILPGWGQAYNHHWWKIPLIYGGLGSLASAAISNYKDYKDFLAVVRFKQLGKPSSDPMYANDPRVGLYQKYGENSRISLDALINAKDGSFRNFEISIMGFLAVWGVNVVDAYIYAKLKHSYSMDNNFGIKVSIDALQPMYASNFNNFTPALKLTITLK